MEVDEPMSFLSVWIVATMQVIVAMAIRGLMTAKDSYIRFGRERPISLSGLVQLMARKTTRKNWNLFMEKHDQLTLTRKRKK